MNVNLDPVIVTIGVIAFGSLVGIILALIHDGIEDRKYEKYLAEHYEKYGRMPMTTRTR
jgi:hypothetical protein